MKVLVGSSFGIVDPYVRDNGEGGGGQDDGGSSLRRSIKEGNETLKVIGSGLGNGKSVDDDSSESSSIGAESEEDEDNDDDVVSSEKSLGSLASLEDSLPIKKGLSNYYSGKSRSFADLSQLDSISCAKDLGKPENPFNKRRRIQMANKWYSSSSCSSSMRSSSSSSSSSKSTLQNSISVPLLPLNEEDGIGDAAEALKQQKQGEEEEENRWLKSESCFEISDLDEEKERMKY